MYNLHCSNFVLVNISFAVCNTLIFYEKKKKVTATDLYFCLWHDFLSTTVQHPDPNQPKPEGGEMRPLNGEPLGVVTNWPPSLLASLQRWGTTQPKSPCLTALDNAGKPVYTLTYGTDVELPIYQFAWECIGCIILAMFYLLILLMYSLEMVNELCLSVNRQCRFECLFL